MSNNQLAVYSVQETQQIAEVIAKSGLFGVKDVTQAMALMLVAQAEGRHPATVARDYHIVQGRPTLKADAMLARFQEAGGRVNWVTVTESKVEAVFSHPQGGEVAIDWTIEMAKKAGLLEKPGPWRQYPRAMLRARIISEGIRTVYPAVIAGTYTPEEVQDLAEPATEEPRRKSEAQKPAPEIVEAEVVDTLSVRRLRMIQELEKMGVSLDQLLNYTRRSVVEDINLNDIEGLAYKFKDIKDGKITIQETFSAAPAPQMEVTVEDPKVISQPPQQVKPAFTPVSTGNKELDAFNTAYAIAKKTIGRENVEAIMEKCGHKNTMPSRMSKADLTGLTILFNNAINDGEVPV